jgi:pimeloyl-ACP methyl ester carboxylesterase
MAFVETRGASIYYEARGDGPCVVFAHGAGGNAASWWQQVPFFVGHGFRVVVFDHRGFGRSRGPSRALDLREFPADLLAILDAERVGRAALVCQSMGGWTGLGTASRFPERVSALVLCGTPGGVFTPAVERAMRGLAERPRAQREDGGAVPGAVAFAADFPKREPRRALLYEQIQAFNPPLDPAAIAEIARVRVTEEQLASFRVPTLVIAGDEDALFPLDALEEVARAIPGARLARFRGVGHSSYFERPNRFNRRVLSFLEKHARGAS